MPYHVDWSIILVVILKNHNIGFPPEMDFCLHVSATVIALPKYHSQCVLFWLFIYLFIYFSEIKTQNFQDDDLLGQKIHAFIHFFNNWSKPVSFKDNFSLPPPYPSINYPNIVTFHLVSGDLRGGNDKNILFRNAM